MLNNKRLISISLFILALSFSLVKAQAPTSNTTITITTDNTTTVNTTITNINTTTVTNNTNSANSTTSNNTTAANITNTVVNNTNFCSSTNVSRALECWLQPNCMPCMVSNGFVCLPMVSNGTQGQIITGNVVCESNCSGYVPNPRKSIWDGEKPWIYKLVHRQDMSFNRSSVALRSQSYFENVTQQFESIRQWTYNSSYLENIQSLVNQSSNATTVGLSAINQTMSTLMNDWSLDIQQNQNFTNTSITDLAQMWNLRYQAINQSIINATYTAQLVRQYYNISSVYYCFAAQRLQQHLTVLREFLSLVESVQEVALYSSYQKIGTLYEQRYLCSSSLASNGTSNNGTSTSNSTVSSTSNVTTSGNETSTSNGSSSSNSTTGTGTTVVQNITVTINVTTVTNTTTNTTVTTTSNSTAELCSSWNSTYYYQNITSEQIKQTLIWYYLWQIEEVRSYIEEVYANASDLVTKKCEEEIYFGNYLDTQITNLGNNQCVSNLTNLFNVTSNSTFINDTMDILMDFMQEVNYVNATVVNQNDNATASNLTWLFTVERYIDWNNQTLYNISTEFCNSIIPYLVAVYGAGVNTTWCNASLAQIVNVTQEIVVCQNETSTNQSSTVPSPSSSNSSSSVPAPSESSNSTNSTSNEVPSPSTSTTTTNSTTTTTTTSSSTNSSSSSNSTSSSSSSSDSSSSNTSTTTTTSTKRQADTVLPQNTTTNSTTITVNTTIVNTTIVVVNSTVTTNTTVPVNTTVPCNETVPSPSVISTNQTGNNTNSTETRRSKIIFTIPVYMFRCNATNVTISNSTTTSNTTVIVIGGNTTNSTTTVSDSPQPVPAISRNNQGSSNPPSSGLSSSSSFLAVSVLTLLLLACMV